MNKKTKYAIDDLPVQMSAGGEEIVAELKSETFESLDQFTAIYKNRIRYRKTGATSLNEASSRSHCCIAFSVEKLD